MTPLAAARAQSDPPIDCSNAQTQVDMDNCAGQDFQKADAELNRVYKQAMKAAKDQDKALQSDSPDLVGAVDALKKAQRGWIDYRDGECEGEGFQSRGGTMEPMLVSGCKADLTEKRTKELNELIKGMGN
jgi:uncharacterized protein YecT (DUF1311 family)